MKSRLATEPVLRPPDYTLPFCLSVDTSDLAIGATLFQLVDGLEHSICFYSKKLDAIRYVTPPSRKRHFPLFSLFATLAYILAMG